MPNIFVDLPIPGSDGPGTAVDTSAIGKDKTIVIAGDLGTSAVSIEASCDGGTTYVPVAAFTGQAGKKEIELVAEWMRVNVQNIATASGVNVDVGGNSNGGQFVTLPTPVGDGAGTPVDISALGNFDSILVSGAFAGTAISVEISEDGTDYVACTRVFSGTPGHESGRMIGNWMRTRVQGRSGAPFSAVVAVGGENDPTAALATDHGALLGLGDDDHAQYILNTGARPMTLVPVIGWLIDGRTNPRGITTGAVRQEHTAAVPGTRAFHWDIDSAGLDDTKGIVIRHDLNGSSAVINPQNANLEADIDGATNAHLEFLKISKVGNLGAGMILHGLNVYEDIYPVVQHTGGLSNIEQAWSYDLSLTTYSDVTAQFASAAADVQLFAEDGDIVYIGNAAPFGRVSILLEIAADNPGVKPIFEYSKGAGVWGALATSDTTNGMRSNGNWLFLPPSDWATDSVNGVSKYYIRATRNTSASFTLPTEDVIQYNDATTFEWTPDGDLDIRSLRLMESAAVPDGTPASGKGAIWIKDDASVKYTDDTGAETTLSRSYYERETHSTVAQGTAAEAVVMEGRAMYAGSAVALSIDLDDVVTVGTITCRLKVAGVTKITAILNTTDTIYKVETAAEGTHAIAVGDEISVTVETSSLTTSGAGTPDIDIYAGLMKG
jgi:hypothetical protein